MEMGNSIKRRLAAAILLFSFLLAGCSQEGTGKPADEANGTAAGVPVDAGEEARVPESSWRDIHVGLGKQYETAFVKGDRVYGCYRENEKLVVVCQDKVSGTVETQADMQEVRYLYSMDADSAGNVYLVGGNEEYGESMLWKIDASGKCTEMGDIVLERTRNADFIEYRGFFRDDSGRAYVWCEMGIPLAEVTGDRELESPGAGTTYKAVNRIYVKDENMNTLFWVQVSDHDVVSFNVSSAGRPVLVEKDSGGICFQEIDLDKRELTEVMQAGNADSPEEISYATASGEGILFCQGDGLYMYRHGTKQCEKLLNLSSYGVDVSGLLYMGADGGNMEFIDSYESVCEYTELSEGAGEKTVVTLGVMQASGDLAQVIAGFNRGNGDLRVEVVSYYNEELGYDGSAAQLKMDIVTGKAPDVMDVSGLNCGMLADKGVLVDLYGYMGQDGECSADMLMPTVAKAYERDGALYSVAPGFQIYSMWGKSSVFGSKELSENNLCR